MKKLYPFTLILLSILSYGQTPINIVGANIPYNEDFSGMGVTETIFLPGWSAINTIDGTTLTMASGDGSSAIGNIYNVGTNGSEDRAFGSLADATTIPAFGAVFTNNTGSNASKITIQTKMEQWRESNNVAVNEVLEFSYSLDATALNNGTWTKFSALDLNEKLTAASSNSAINGNLAANYTLLSTIITGINWANGANLWIKWTDSNDSGNNGLYAIDNFSLSITETLGLKQNTISGLNMYPNPVSNGVLYITSSSEVAKSIEIFDLLGKQVLNSKTSNNSINVSELRAGTHFVKITEDGKTNTKKLIIQ